MKSEAVAEAQAEKGATWDDSNLADHLEAMMAPEVTPEPEKPKEEVAAVETPEAKVEEPEAVVEEVKPEEDEIPAKTKVEFTAEQQKIFEKRVGKEVAKRKELEDRLEEQKALLAQRAEELSELKARPEAVAPVVPASTGGYSSLADVETRIEQASKLLEFASQNWDGFEGDDTQKPIDARDIRLAHSRLTKELMVELPKARRALEERERVNTTVVRELYPELLDARSKEGQIAANFLRRYPQLNADPGVMVLIGDMIAGERLRNEKKTAKPVAAVAPAKPRAPAAPTQPAASAPAVPQSDGGIETKRASAQKKLRETGYGSDALAEYLESF